MSLFYEPKTEVGKTVNTVEVLTVLWTVFMILFVGVRVML